MNDHTSHYIFNNQLIQKNERQCEKSFKRDFSDTDNFQKMDIPPTTNIRPFLSPPSPSSTMTSFLHDTLPTICNLLHDAEPIVPAQCTQILTDMKELKELLKMQREKLDTPFLSPHDTECVVLRCRITVALSYAMELTQKLISLFLLLQIHCHAQSKQTIQTREEIMHYLPLLIRSYTSIVKNVEKLAWLQRQAQSRQKGNRQNYPYLPLRQ